MIALDLLLENRIQAGSSWTNSAASSSAKKGDVNSTSCPNRLRRVVLITPFLSPSQGLSALVQEARDTSTPGLVVALSLYVVEPASPR